MSDIDSLQGLWKIETMTSRGNAVGHSDTHWQFDGDRVQKISPDLVDGGAWATFALDETATPKRMEQNYVFVHRDGTEYTLSYKSCYALFGDTLTVGGAEVYGEYPLAVSDDISTVTTLSRFLGARPAVRQASGTKPIESATLGTVTWNDNFRWWNAELALAPGQMVRVSLTPGKDADKNDISAGEDFVQWAKAHDTDARAYAAQEMTETAEDWRDEDETSEPITAESFARRITLSEITFEADGSGMLWYDDDDIFFGHVIAVSVTADRTFTDAQMMG